jgi:tRNA(Ile)-lysidine synthase
MMLIDRVRRTVRRHGLAGPETRVVVALSGGPDSVALAYLVRELAAAGALRAAGAAHFNHQLRATADRDERLSVALAESFDWPFVTEREDVLARARRERRSVEHAAHAARYAFFERARAQLGADVVALGHTRDDQAETFLLRLLRGAGPRGLAAMHPRHGFIVRPLIDCRRGALRAYLDERRIAYIEDESNRDVAVPRNRVRAELLPMLEARFNPAIVDVLADEAELARDDWTWMEAAADDLAARVVTRRAPATLELEVAALMQAPPALRRLVTWRAMTEMAGERPVSFEHVEAALQVAGSTGGSPCLDAPGQRVQREGERLVLTSRGPGAVGASGTARAPRRSKGSPAELAVNFFRYPLSIPGEVQLPEANCILSVETMGCGAVAGRTGPCGVTEAPGPGILALLAGGAVAADTVAIVRSDVCRGPLAVRNRRPGDRFRPLGLGGRKKLQDFFVDRKVARRDRDFVPLIVDDTDRIVWVAGHGGHGIDEEFRVTDAAQGVLILKLKQLGGPD